VTGPQFATNAVVHSASRHGGAFVLRAAAGRDRLRIEVEDAGGPRGCHNMHVLG